MVNIDLDVKGIIGLAENSAIKKEDFKKYMDKFSKEDLIKYHVDTIYIEDEETPDTEEEGADI